jgi:oligopeptide transport system substrate-binding protein
MGWLAAFADPVSHLQTLTSSNLNNHTGWKSSAYDALVARIEKLEPGPERRKLIVEAQSILHQKECPVIPIYHYVQTHAVSGRIDGFAVNGMGIVRWDELRLKK